MAMSLNDSLVSVGGGDSRLDFGGGASGGGGAPAALVGSNSPTQRFDISVLSGLKPSDKYLGKNRVSDIQEAYSTYLSGNPVGRGGQYAVDAARRYGTTITEAARGYLATVGLPTLADVVPDTGGGSGGSGGGVTPDDLKKLQDDLNKRLDELKDTGKGNPVELLLDAIPRLVGNAAARAPLQTQAYGYTPVSGDFGGESSGSGLGMWLLLGAVGIAAYFIYKRYASN